MMNNAEQRRATWVIALVPLFLMFCGPVLAAGTAKKLSDLGCTTDQIAKFDGTEWVCADDDSGTDSDTLADLGCSEGDIAQRVGSGWTCQSLNEILYRKVVFVSTTLFDGSMDAGGGGGTGVELANNVCGSEAYTAGLKGHFKAWLSTSTQDARDLLPPGAAPPYYYTLVDGTLIANDKQDLLKGYIRHPINQKADGSEIAGQYVWTGTVEDGTFNSDGGNCDDWTDPGTIGTKGTVGSTDNQERGWTNYYDLGQECYYDLPVYCFQL